MSGNNGNNQDILAQFAARSTTDADCHTIMLLMLQRQNDLVARIDDLEKAVAPVKQGKSLFVFLLMLGTMTGSILAIWDRVKGMAK